ncbi:gag protease polyprotein [Cucumis melo var. makuwa]|uniref:Gag protease polyprotein n=1 Tax=Cucumis melo var. makuwa TaxID=1194695 RepID=A0A5A7TT61_CUCMM|nr:gag protease polyprotein [Cucumis melo var. makuwa]TYK11937.1 gag protease polyprotein [Cucumis melo var. makuwa]
MIDKFMFGTTFNSCSNFLSQTASFAASQAVTYSSFIVDSAMHPCLMLRHTTASPFRVNTDPDVDLLESLSVWKSESVYSRSTAVAAPFSISFRSHATSRRRIKELTLKFSGSAAGLIGDSSPLLGVNSIKGHNHVSRKGFLTTGPRIEAGNVVIPRGLYVSSVTASCSLCDIVCNELFTDRHRCPDVLCIVVVLVGYVVSWNCMSVDLKVLMLGKSTARGRPTRGKKDAWYQSLSCRFCRLTYDVSLCFCVLMAKTILATRQGSLVVVREMSPRRGARRGGRGGRGRGAGCVQPEVQPVTQATYPTAPVTHADLAAMEQRFRDLIMQMREQQQPASPAPAPIPVVSQVVPDQLPAEAKHLRDFRKYNPTTFDGSLEDPTRAQL